MNPKKREELSGGAIVHKRGAVRALEISLAHAEEQVWYSAWGGQIEISILLS